MDDQTACREWLETHFAGDERIGARSLRGNTCLTEGIWRISDNRRSVIAKVITSARERTGDPWIDHWSHNCLHERHWNYWRREFLVYRNGVPSKFADAGVSAPSLLEAFEAGGRVIMFLEDCQLAPATRWEAVSYCAAARDLGVAQGSLVNAGEISDPPWFCQNYIFDYALEKPFDRSLVTVDDAWTELIDAGVLSPADKDLQIRFGLNERRLLSLLNAVPMTICHNDFWTRNLFGDSMEVTTVVDWSFLGRGPIGADVANMVASAGFDGFISGDNLATFSEEIFEAYLSGLRQGGWTGSERLVRLGYWASAAKYAWVVAAMLTSLQTAGHPIYVGYGDGGALDFRAVAATLNMLARWSERVEALYGI